MVSCCRLYLRAFSHVDQHRASVVRTILSYYLLVSYFRISGPRKPSFGCTRIAIHRTLLGCRECELRTGYFRVSKVHVHPSYNSSDFRADLAILMLSSPVEFTMYVRPVCLWSPSFTELKVVEGKDGTVIGWGYDEFGQVTEELMMATMPIVSQQTCLWSYPQFFSHFTSNKTYCAGFREEVYKLRILYNGVLWHLIASILWHTSWFYSVVGLKTHSQAKQHYTNSHDTCDLRVSSQANISASFKIRGPESLLLESLVSGVWEGWETGCGCTCRNSCGLLTDPEQVYAMVTVEGAWFSPYVSQMAQISGILGGSSALVFHKKTNGFVTLRPIHVRSKHYSNARPGTPRVARRTAGEVAYSPTPLNNSQSGGVL
uniref:Peptidase S1 domain-containing protein n=1 Tax=Timema bartmani TaxID=61472 RepID=A0A7R9I134_9NEOP|nr:unnamed protein product [Timema bartmani]